MRYFHAPSLEMSFFISVCLLFARTQSCGYFYQYGKLENVVWLCVEEELRVAIR